MELSAFNSGNFTNSSCTWAELRHPKTEENIRIVVTVFSTLSILCDFGVIVYFNFRVMKPEKEATRTDHKDIKSRFVTTCLTSMAVADIINSISHILGVWTAYNAKADVEGDSFAQCGAQAVFTAEGTLATFLWIDVFIIGTVFDSMVDVVEDSHRGKMLVHSFCWGVPMLTAAFMTGFDVLGVQNVNVGKPCSGVSCCFKINRNNISY